MMKHIVAALALMLAAGTATAQTATTGDDVRQHEREAYNQARQAGTVEAWEVFINNYPDSYYIEQARKLRDAATVNQYCNEATTLDRLVAYIDNAEAHEPRIITFYANLVNNPTHSYRLQHLDLGFNGCTGRVDETVTLASGAVRHNQFVFNPQGLLTQSSIEGSNGKRTVTNYTYAYDNLHGYSLKQSSRKGKTIAYAPIYDTSDRLDALKADNGMRQQLHYTAGGTLDRLVVTQPGKPKRTLLYKDGYIIRDEQSGKAYRYMYDFDEATGKKFLIAIRELQGSQTVHERTFDYRIDTHGRYTTVTVKQDGKLQMTIQRTYSD